MWTWTKSPEKRFIKVSYSDSLSRKHNILSRDIIRSPWYQGNWGDRFVLKDDVNRQNEFENNHHGMMFSTSVGGAITGNGADVIIIDDPQNPLMANSETERQNSIDFFKNTLQTRLNDPKTGAFIIIMQRLHENDLTGYILAEDLGYTHLCLPAEAPVRTIITFPKTGRQVVREEGDILNPQRFDHEVLAGLKKSMGSLQYARTVSTGTSTGGRRNLQARMAPQLLQRRSSTADHRHPVVGYGIHEKRRLGEGRGLRYGAQGCRHLHQRPCKRQNDLHGIRGSGQNPLRQMEQSQSEGNRE